MKDIDLVRKIVWSFHSTTQLDWDDLFQEASLAYLEALRTHDPKKGKITTYLWCVISNTLKNYIRREARVNPPTSDLAEAYYKPCPQDCLWENLPVATYDAVKIILDNQTVLNGLESRDARKRIRIILRKEGFTNTRIRKSFSLLRKMFEHY